MSPAGRARSGSRCGPPPEICSRWRVLRRCAELLRAGARGERPPLRCEKRPVGFAGALIDPEQIARGCRQTLRLQCPPRTARPWQRARHRLQPCAERPQSTRSDVGWRCASACRKASSRRSKLCRMRTCLLQMHSRRAALATRPLPPRRCTAHKHSSPVSPAGACCAPAAERPRVTEVCVGSSTVASVARVERRRGVRARPGGGAGASRERGGRAEGRDRGAIGSNRGGCQGVSKSMNGWGRWCMGGGAARGDSTCVGGGGGVSAARCCGSRLL